MHKIKDKLGKIKLISFLIISVLQNIVAQQHLNKSFFKDTSIKITEQPETIKFLDTSQLVSRTIITDSAYCSDGSDRSRLGNPRFHGPMEAQILSFKNYQYISYYESRGDLVVARKKIAPSTQWQKSIVKGYKMHSQDRHNKIAMEISEGDGVIHLSFDHHNTPQINYAKSEIGVVTNPESVVWNDSVFTLVPNLGLKEDTGLVTYPNFFKVVTTGDIVLYWRTGGAIGGEMNLANYNSKDHKWYFVGKISSRKGSYMGKAGTRGPYHAGFKSDDKGILHLAWLWREEMDLRNGAEGYGNHGLYYAQSPDGGFNWNNNKGKQVANVKSNLQMSIDNVGKVPIEIPMALNPSNVGFSSVIEPNTNDFLVLINHYNKDQKNNLNYLYKRNSEGAWKIYETNIEGSGKLFFYKDKLFFLNKNMIRYSDNKCNYKKWKIIEFPIQIEPGSANWETNQLDKGILSMVIQYSPEKIGDPTSIEVFDFKIMEFQKK
jgi:hypothetical protein